MPIRVQCPGCGGKFAAPDAAAGRTLKCPKCQAGVAVPAPKPPPVEEPDVVPVEVVDDDPPPAAPDEAPPPKKKKKRAPEGPSKNAKVAAGVMAFLFVAGIVGAMARGKPNAPWSNETKAMTGADGRFEAVFPGGEPTHYADAAKGVDDWSRAHGGADYTVSFAPDAPPPGKLTETDRRLAGVLAAGGKVLHEEDVESNGVAGREVAVRGSRTVVVREYRYGPGGKYRLTASVSGGKSLDPDGDEVQGFLESVVPKP